MYRLFYQATWLIQILASLGLFAISFWVQAQVLLVYVGDPRLAFGLAAGLETTKVLTLVLLEIYRDRGDPHRGSVRAAGWALRTGLLGFSALATLMFLAAAFDRPMLAEVRAADLAREQQRHHATISALRNEQDQITQTTREELEKVFQRQRQTLANDHRPGIHRLEQALNAEMNVVDGQGHFEGPRYRALQDRLATARGAYGQAQRQLDTTQAESLSKELAGVRLRMAQARAEERARYDQAEQILSAKSYADDERVDAPQTRALLRILRELGGLGADSLSLAVGVSLILAVLVELGIFVGFAYIGHYARDAFSVGERIQRKQTQSDEVLEEFALDSRAQAKKAKLAVDRVFADPGPELESQKAAA